MKGQRDVNNPGSPWVVTRGMLDQRYSLMRQL